MTSRDQKLLQALGSTGIARVLAMAVAVIQVPIVISYLGKEAYGFWLLCSSLAGWVVLSDLGMSNGLLNALSRAYAKDDPAEARSVFSSCLAMLGGIAVVGSVLLLPVIATLPIENWFHLQQVAVRDEARLVVYISLILPLWSLVADGWMKPYMAYQEVRVANLWLMLGSLLSLALVILATRLNGGVAAIILGSFSGHFFCRIAAGVQMVTWKRPYLRPRLSAVSIERSKKLFQTGSRFLIISVSWLLLVNIDQIVISSFLGADHNAAYGLAMKIFSYVMMIPNILHLSLWPAYAEAAERGDHNWIRSRFFRSLYVSVGLVGIILGCFAMFGQRFVLLWTKNVVTIDTPILLWMIVLGMAFAAVSQLTALLNAVERFRSLITGVVAAALVNLVLSILLVQWLREPGVMIATASGLILQCAIIAPEIKKFLRSVKPKDESIPVTPDTLGHDSMR